MTACAGRRGSSSVRSRRGAHRRELEAYFGHARICTARALARRAARRRDRTRRGGRASARRPRSICCRVSSGSQLGRLRSRVEPPDLLWLDPADIVDGRLIGLRWQARATAPEAAAPARDHRLQLPGAEAAAAGRRLRGGAVRLRLARGPAVAAAERWPRRLRPTRPPSWRWSVTAWAVCWRAPRWRRRDAADRATHPPRSASVRRTAARSAPCRRCAPPIRCVLRLAAIDRHNDAATHRDVFASFMSVYQLLPAPRRAAGSVRCRELGRVAVRSPMRRCWRGARLPLAARRRRDARLSRSSAPASARSPGSSGAAVSFATRSAPPATAPWRARAPRCRGGRVTIRCAASTVSCRAASASPRHCAI